MEGALVRDVNKARHKCRVERAKPVSEQVGAVQCKDCERWFRSKGGLCMLARERKMTRVKSSSLMQQQLK